MTFGRWAPGQRGLPFEWLRTRDPAVPARRKACAVQAIGEASVEDLIDERRLTGPADARDSYEKPQRDFNVDVFRVVFSRPLHA